MLSTTRAANYASPRKSSISGPIPPLASHLAAIVKAFSPDRPHTPSNLPAVLHSRPQFVRDHSHSTLGHGLATSQGSISEIRYGFERQFRKSAVYLRLSLISITKSIVSAQGTSMQPISEVRMSYVWPWVDSVWEVVLQACHSELLRIPAVDGSCAYTQTRRLFPYSARCLRSPVFGGLADSRRRQTLK